MLQRFRCELIPWTAIYRLARALSFKIIDSGFQPDVVVAVGRGGYVPARIVCDFLNISALTAIKIEHWATGARRKERAALCFPLNTDIAGQRVLVVDDVTDTGHTLRAASAHLASYHPGLVKFAVLHHKITSSFEPDFLTHRVIKWRWIIYPWAAIEDIGGFLSQYAQAPGNLEEARQRLREDYGLSPPKQILEDIWTLYAPAGSARTGATSSHHQKGGPV